MAEEITCFTNHSVHALDKCGLKKESMQLQISHFDDDDDDDQIPTQHI